MNVDNQRDFELDDAFHCRANDLLHVGKFVGRRLQNKFVVHLQDYSTFEPAQIFFGANHCKLDDVSRRALNRRVHCRAFREGAQIKIPVVNRGQRPPSAEKRRHVAASPCVGDSRVEKIFHAGIAFKVARDVFARLLARNVQVTRKSVVADSVDDAEIDSLSFAAQVGRNVVDGHAKNFGGSSRVNVLPAIEGVD